MISADARAVLGSTGSGKSAYVKQCLNAERPSRLLVLDPKNEYHNKADAKKYPLKWVKRASLSEIARARHGASYAYAFVPGFAADGRRNLAYTAKQRAAEFDLFCNICIDVGALTCVVDELHLFTSASYAPDPWATLSRMGRSDGLQLFGASQRPADIDKSFLSNCTMIHCGMLAEPNDAKAVAARIPGIEWQQLLGQVELEYVQYNKLTRALSRGVISLKKAKNNSVRAGGKTPL